MWQEGFWGSIKELARVLCLIVGWLLAIVAGVWGAASMGSVFSGQAPPGGLLMHLGAPVVAGIAMSLVAARGLFLPSRHFDRILERNSVRPLVGATLGLALGVMSGILLAIALPVPFDLDFILAICVALGGMFLGLMVGATGRKSREPVMPACPQCGYCLHGLTSSRCPECGHFFRAWGPWSRGSSD